MKHVPRVYADQALAIGALVVLDDAAGHHLARVLRLRAGDPVVVFNGRGGEFPGQVMTTRPRSVQIRIECRQDRERESPMRITLVQGLSRGARMDYTVEKATELGVDTIVPANMNRSVLKLDNERAGRRRAHWNKVAIAACQQCGRNRLPTILEPVTLAAYLRDTPPPATGLVLDPYGERLALAQLAGSPQVTLLVGPEGGLDEEERVAALAAGFKPVALGPRVLRTETAAVAGLTVLQYLGGDLGSDRGTSAQVETNWTA